jgi:NAD(P)-dependent dehydrogenase (short-subunit alcohol dehydrogenase family)
MRPNGRSGAVNAIAPGYFPSKMTDAIPEEESRVIEGDTPMRRWGRPEDMAGVALYLASRASGFVCGATLVVDGGLATTG